MRTLDLTILHKGLYVTFDLKGIDDSVKNTKHDAIEIFEDAIAVDDLLLKLNEGVKYIEYKTDAEAKSEFRKYFSTLNKINEIKEKNLNGGKF